MSAKDLAATTESPPVAASWNHHDCRPVTLTALFVAQALATPTAIALQHGEERLDYADLNGRANRLARRLCELEIQPGDRVGISLARSSAMLISILACLKIRAVIVPLDPGYPLAHRRFMASDAQLSLLVCDTIDQAPECNLWLWQELWQECQLLDDDELPAAERAVADLQDPVYLLYTSGSTGEPKGVLMEHGPVSQLIQWQIAQHAHYSSLRTLQFSSLNFDVSFWEIFSTLCAGHTLVLVDDAIRRDGTALYRYLLEQGVERLLIPYVALQQLAIAAQQESRVPPLREVAAAGEPLLVTPAIRAWFRRMPACRLHNAYGPTEAHVVVSQYTLPPTPSDQWSEWPPIGKALANVRLYLLDEHGHSVPPGETGHLHIGGPSLARGYWRRPELTGQRFIRHPATGERLYASGDLARLNADGNIEYLGRNDQQVKIRGFRVEIGDVEARMSALDGIEQAAVVAVTDPSGARQLRAFYAGDGAPSVDALAAALAAKLPDFMLPARYQHLDSLPTTPSGKIDRNALRRYQPPKEGDEPDVYDQEPAAGIARLWKALLDLPKAGPQQNFFRLGGHSLLATRLLVGIEQHTGIRIPLSRLLQAPTLEQLIALVEGAAADDDHQRQDLPTITADPEHRYRPFPLTAVQQAYWLGRSAVFDLGNISTHVYAEIQAEGLDIDRLEQAWQGLVKRHDMMRARIRPDGNQEVLEQTPDFRMSRHDWRQLAPAEVEARLIALREQLSHQVLEAERWPLFDLHASRLPGGMVRLHVSIDILIMDILSLSILYDEWYRRYLDPEAELPPLPDYTYRDYLAAEQQMKQGARHAAARQYWLKRIPDLPPAPDLPLARQPAAIQIPRFVRHAGVLDRERWQRLQAAAAARGVTPSALLLAVFSEVLARWSRSPRFTVNLTLFNRLPLDPGIDRLIGDFTSITLLDLDCGVAGASFSDLVQQVQKRLWQDLDHREFSGVEVLRELNRQTDQTHRQNMPVVFTSGLGLEADSERGEFHGLRSFGTEVFALTQTSQAWLDHQAGERDGALYYNWDVLEAMFPAGLIEAMIGAYGRRLRDLVDSDDAWRQPVARGLLPESQRLQRAVNTIKAPVSEYRLHELFLARARDWPDAIAVIDTERELGYGQLERASAVLAMRLREHGTTPGDRVLLLLDKGWRQVVAVLACLRARTVFVPLDSLWPAHRLQAIARQVDASVLLTDPAAADQSVDWAEGATCLVMSEDLLSVGEGHQSAAEAELARVDAHGDAGDLAYIIFTSGSTGIPKGVAIDHRGAVNTLLDINRRFRVTGSDRVLALSALSFDLAIYDIFGLLAVGGALVLPPSAASKDPVQWAELMRRHHVTLWNSVPALLQMLLEYLQAAEPDARPLSLRLAMLSGDWIPLGLPDEARRQWPDIELQSLGGATEASIWSIHYPIAEMPDAASRLADDWPSVPYGKPLDNQHFYVLDSQLRETPDWVVGELYIGGVGLARGYWGDQQLTAERFFAHPQSGERLYRTGDLGCYLPDGNIRFLGRIDTQVKLAGYRIELGEIANVLLQAPGVLEAEAVMCDQRLIGFVRCRQTLSMVTLKEWCLERLPDYMLPAAIYPLTTWPLSANGKLDRGQLMREAHARMNAQPAAVSPAIPADGLERVIGQLWSRVLERDDIGRDESFFEAGGDSLLATRLYNRLHERFPDAAPLSVLSIFQYPSIASQAGLIKRLTMGQVPAVDDSPSPVHSNQPRSRAALRSERLKRLAEAKTKPTGASDD